MMNKATKQDDLQRIGTAPKISAKEPLPDGQANQVEKGNLQRQLTALQTAISTVSSSLDLQQVLDTLTSESARFLEASASTLRSWHSEDNSLRVLSQYGPHANATEGDAEGIFWLDHYPLMEAVLRSQQPRQITVGQPDLEPGALALMQEAAVASQLLLPLVYQDRVLGLLEVSDRETRVFSDQEVAFGQLFANQAAVAIENARRLVETEKQMREQRALREAAMLFASTLDLETLVRYVAEQLGKAIAVSSVYIADYKPEEKSANVLAGYHSPHVNAQEGSSSLHTVFNLAEEFPRSIDFITKGETGLAHSDDPDLDENLRAHMQKHNCKSILSLPVKIDGNFNAYAELWESRKRRDFSPEEVALAKAIAQQAEKAVEHARLFEKMQKEIKQRKHIEGQLRHDAFHDTLTGLPNRALFLDRLRRAILRSRRNKERTFAVLFLDLDRFKVVNDSLGHRVGDELLVKLARRMKNGIREVDTVARFGGDEFVFLLEDVPGISEASRFAERIQERISIPVDVSGNEVCASASIGIVISSEDYDTPEEYLRDADLAMYHAKAIGKARFKIFSPTLRFRAMSRLTLETDLRQAIENDEFIIYYQPVISLETGKIDGFEALLRWEHPERGLLLPDDFIALAEETGLIVPVGQWVLTEACLQLSDWQARFPQDPPLTISVNLSSKQLSHPNLLSMVAQTLQMTNLAPGSLSLEVTEGDLIIDPDEVALILHKLKKLGVDVHLDDFGTGYSSLAYLRHFPLDVVKIDRSFIGKLTDDDSEIGLVRTIVQLAQELGMRVVAEGIESDQQLAKLRDLGCSYGQGFYISKPQDSAGAENFLKHLK